jgi:hypothetical protein
MYLSLGILFGAFALFDTFHIFRDGNKKLYLFLLLIFILFIIVAFRKCGFDYENYSYYFEALNSLSWINNSDFLRVEKGYAYLNYVCSSYREVLLIMAFFTVGLISYFIYKYSPLPFFSLFLLLGTFVYPAFMGQYRQALALSIVLLASSFRHKKILFLCLIYIASLFHVSSFLAIMFLFIPNKLYQRKVYLILLTIALIMNLFVGVIFSKYISSFPAFMAEKLNIYSNSEKGMSLGLNMAMLLRTSIFIVFWKGREIFQSYKYGFFFFNAYFLSLLIYLGLGFLPQLGGRGSLFFYVFEIVLAAMLIDRVHKYKFFIISFFMLLSIYRQLSFFNQWSSDYIPYSSYLGNIFGFL